MKKTILLMALLAFLFITQAQQIEKKSKTKLIVPEAVKSAFKSAYPAVTNVKWDSEKTGEYEAEFKINKVEVSVVYDEKGNLLETETEITIADLPQAVKDAIAKEFAGYKIEEAEKVEKNGVLTYELEVEKGKQEYVLFYDSNGKLLSKEEEKKGKDND